MSKILFLFAVLFFSSSLCAARRFSDDAFFSLKFATMCVSTPPRVRAVFENHIAQFNACSVQGLKDERTPETKVFLGNTLIEGEMEVDALFAGFCKERKDGGLKGLKVTELKAFVVGNTINVLWEANAPFLSKPYLGSDAYVTCGNKMLTIVSSFDPSELEFKE